MQRLFHTDPAHERNECLAARQENVLTVVDFVSIDDKGGGASAQEPASLEHVHGTSRFVQIEGSRESGEPRSNDCYTGRSQEPTITSNFSDADSDVRPRSGKSGSRSIFSRMRS